MGHSRPFLGPAASNTAYTARWMLGGRKCTCTSKSPGSPRDSQNARTGATSGWGGFEARSARTSTTGPRTRATSGWGGFEARSARTSTTGPRTRATSGWGGFEARSARTSTTGPRTGATSGSSVTHALQVPAEGLLLLPIGLPLGERGALVPGLLALRERDLDLRPAVLEVERQRDDGEALLADPALDLVDLDPVEEQLALAAGGVVGPGALGVLRDVHAVQPGLVAVDLDEPVDQGRAPQPQRLHLGALEDQAGLVGVLDVVVVARLLVLRYEPAPLLPGHPSIL